MITAGIDIGHQSVNTVILNEASIISHTTVVIAGEVEAAASVAWDNAINDSGMKKTQIDALFATGVGREKVSFAQGNRTEMLANVRGAFSLFPGMRTVINVGAEGSRILKCDGKGNLTNFIMNDKCASGAGVFLETVSEMMQVALVEMGPLSLKHTKKIPLTTTCAVFAESEIVAEIHRGTAKEDILWGVHASIAAKIFTGSKRAEIEPDLVFTGGVALNSGVVEAFRNQAGIEIHVPEHPEIVGALGAAILARDSV